MEDEPSDPHVTPAVEAFIRATEVYRDARHRWIYASHALEQARAHLHACDENLSEAEKQRRLAEDDLRNEFREGPPPRPEMFDLQEAFRRASGA